MPVPLRVVHGRSLHKFRWRHPAFHFGSDSAWLCGVAEGRRRGRSLSPCAPKSGREPGRAAQMTSGDLQLRLSDLVGFQCALLALRGAGPEASEEMVWQTLLSALVDQYGFQRAWYARCARGVLLPAIVVPTPPDQSETGSSDSGPSAVESDFELPVSIEDRVEGRL